MNDKRFERIYRTFHDQFISFYHIKNVDSPTCIVRHCAGKPVAAGFDKLIFMQTGTFLYPAFAFGTRFEMVDQLVAYKLRLPFPLYHMRTVGDVDRTRFAVQPQASPVP